jgi:predicted DNA-binding transcriptional regulator AlpA
MMTDLDSTAALADYQARSESGATRLTGHQLPGAEERTADTAPPSDTVLNDGFLSTEELALLLGVDSSTLRRWRTATPPAGPPFIAISERVTKYCRSDVRDWIRLRRVSTAGSVRPTKAL